MTDTVFVIAEVGSNYDGDLETAKRYITEAKRAGADAVKFQTLRHSKLFAPQVFEDGQWVDNPILKVVANLELPDEWHFALKEHADAEGIEFMSTPFYLEAVDLLERVGVSRYKIASGDLTFRPLLERVAATGKPVILSTGGSSIDEVENAVDTLRNAGADDITLLHCVVSYPPQFDEMNLRAISTLRERFGFPVGLSDHSPGHAVPAAAVALGAGTIEKHVTFDRANKGPDHPFALTWPEFANLVSAVRNVVAALGDGEKKPSEDERKRQFRFRRGVYSEDDFRPVGTGEEGVWLRPIPPPQR